MQFETRPQRILLPVSGVFMAATILGALLANLLPWSGSAGMPDLLALVLVFWGVNQPRKIGIGIAWMLGLIMDTSNGALMGQHALAYAVITFAANVLSRRMLWFPLWPQALHVLFVLLGGQLLMLAVRMIAGSAFPGLPYFFGSIVAAALWPMVTLLLLAPQRRAASVDENRPL